MTVLDVERESELQDLRAAVREVCADPGGPGAVRELAPDGPGFDPRLWEVLGRQMGLAALGLPESADGIGGLAELAIVCEELGPALLPVPFLRRRYLPGKYSPPRGPRPGRRSRGSPPAKSPPSAVDRTGRCVGPAAELLADRNRPARSTASCPRCPWRRCRLSVVAAAHRRGLDVFAVDPGPGWRPSPLDTLDLSRAVSHRHLLRRAGPRLTTGGSAAPSSPRRSTSPPWPWRPSSSAAPQAVPRLTVGYVKERRQFGRAIGSFQAVKHRCADLLVLVETCRSAVVRARDAEAVDRRRWPRRRRWRRSGARTPSRRSPRRPSTSTAASGSPGNTTRTCTSAGPAPTPCSRRASPTPRTAGHAARLVTGSLAAVVACSGCAAGQCRSRGRPLSHARLGRAGRARVRR